MCSLVNLLIEIAIKRLEIPSPAELVKVEVYDLQGKIVEVITEAYQPAGWHEAVLHAETCPMAFIFTA